MNSGLSSGPHGGDDSTDREKNALYELVASAPSRKNWKGMLIAICVIFAILGCILASVIVMTPVDDGPRVKGSRFSLEDVLGDKFQPLKFNGSWLKNNQLLITDGNDNLQILDAPSGTLQPLLYNESIPVPPGSTYSLSPDNRFLLLTTDYRKRPGSIEEFEAKVYDLSTGIVYPIPSASPDERVPIQAVMWSPSPRNGALVYCHQNDIYYIPDITIDQTERITSDGSFNSISNGVPDWTYRAMAKQPAMWFSETGDRLSYIAFNDTAIPEIKLSIYSEPDSFELYTEQVLIRYPTPSSPIPRVSLRVVDLMEKDIVKELRPPLSIRDQEYYLTMVKWVNDQRICAIWTLRSQNVSLISFCDAGPWHCQTVSTIESGLEGWLDVGADMLFHPNGNSFLHLAPVQIDHTQDYFTNIIMVDAVKRHSWPVTQYKSEIHHLLGWDTNNGRNLVYYSASAEGGRSKRQVYRVEINGQKADQNTVECLTCSVQARHLAEQSSHSVTSSTSGSSSSSKSQAKNSTPLNFTSSHPNQYHSNSTCRYSNAILSPSLEYYVHECLGPTIPYVEVRSLPTNKLVKLIQVNRQLQLDSMDKAFPRKIQLKVPLLVDNTPWKRSQPDYVAVELYLPPGLKEEESTVYPLLVWTTDEPATVSVTDEWKMDWATYMASGRDVIVAKIDLHGSQGSGHLLRNSIYRQPGVLEAVDLIQTTKILQETFAFISPIKTALIGSHYGGFLSLYTLANDPGAVFGCGIAISPVSSWKTLTAPYAERYLGLLSEREGQRHYFEADLTTCTKNLHAKKVFLLHGTLEEKYHVTHSMLIAKSLIEKRFSFQQQLYPDANYQMMLRNAQMYESIDIFLNGCYDGREMPELDNTLHKGD
ncbi:prolyl endopeptidase FAP-like isoform X1 [Daphnia pulicaria]|uniref:prolyl endopeptidase FAP-like isoform X1 n=2 Tax=Daphnia pulicaria TaxID=35523 RepID=UPI001EE9FC68|nr:prolyl endopeptidase FAP-like isoform X1 [Daphnia pulicaria]